MFKKEGFNFSVSRYELGSWLFCILCDPRQVMQHPNSKVNSFPILRRKDKNIIYPHKVVGKLHAKQLAQCWACNIIYSTNNSHIPLDISKSTNPVLRKGNETPDHVAIITLR